MKDIDAYKVDVYLLDEKCVDCPNLEVIKVGNGRTCDHIAYCHAAIARRESEEK